MKKTGLIVLILAFMAGGLSLRVSECEAADRVWVPAHTMPNGKVIPGHWRPTSKPGFVWVAGTTVNGTWVAGYWKPTTAAPAGKIWVKGFWRNGKWHAGRWARKKKGTWVPGHYGRGGKWIPGHYR